MADTKEMKALKATSLLKEDHKKVKKLFAQFDKLEDDDAAGLSAIYEKVNRELQILKRCFNLAIEQELLVSNQFTIGGDPGRLQSGAAYVEHPWRCNCDSRS